jgi:hypothetical protein
MIGQWLGRPEPNSWNKNEVKGLKGYVRGDFHRPYPGLQRSVF